MSKRTMDTAEEKSTALLLGGPDITKDETYSQIKGSVPRLHALLAGRFVQYGIYEEGSETYSTWLINEGQDSVMIYHIPVGNPDKIGYWMYNCQVMTSLPNQPLHAKFSKLVEIDRDSIRAVYYEAPEEFETSLNEILENPEKVFSPINLRKLKKMEGADVVYVRENPIHYKAETSWYEDTRATNEGGFMTTYYLIRPKMTVFGTSVYDKDKKYLGQTTGDRLMKNGMINPNQLK